MSGLLKPSLKFYSFASFDRSNWKGHDTWMMGHRLVSNQWLDTVTTVSLKHVKLANMKNS